MYFAFILHKLNNTIPFSKGIDLQDDKTILSLRKSFNNRIMGLSESFGV